MDGFSLIIPYFNEGQMIVNTIEEYGEKFEILNIDYEIIVVDDGSKIKANQFINNSKYKNKLIQHRRNRGYGSAISTGINNSKFENIIITDSDNTYPAEKIDKMVEKYIDNEPCMVIGSREGKGVKIPLQRRPAKYFLRKLASYLCSTNIRDLNSGLRIFKKDFYMENIKLMPKRFSMSSTMTILAAMNDYDIYFVKINYRKRQGKSSISPIKDTIRFFNLILKLVILSDGMRLFFPLSMLLIFSSIILLILRFFGIPVAGATSVILFCSGVQTLSFGALCKCINFGYGRR